MMAATALFVAEKERTPGHIHVLLITTGSVASIKAPLIISELLSVRPPAICSRSLWMA
jgi:phosphopantothenoylcysteine decarboxylase